MQSKNSSYDKHNYPHDQNYYIPNDFQTVQANTIIPISSLAEPKSKSYQLINWIHANKLNAPNTIKPNHSFSQFQPAFASKIQLIFKAVHHLRRRFEST